MILDGQVVREKVLARVREGAERLRAARGAMPCLAVVLVGDDPASRSYVASKKRTAEAVGIQTRDHVYPTGLDQAALVRLLRQLNDDATVHAILLQLPLPAGLDEAAALAAIAPAKDVDGLHPTNLGKLLAGEPGTVPCTPAGCIEILDHYGAELSGAEAVVVGRSRLVGKPLAQLLLARHATVTTCHTRTRDLAAHVRRADVLCVAAGRPGMVTGDMVKDGVWVIDVGFNRLPGGKIVGDVDFESVSRRARGITPVPGGVGPMTIAMLLQNTLAAAEKSFSPSETSPPERLRGQRPRSNA
ncbi:MAG: bifunctional 5,10-methylenetetrahydrofolate dehydrogenase/5,10-methenyltetrahydrofolate cyclohydrolase [Candidatus Rokuibacteriota bacterium]